MPGSCAQSSAPCPAGEPPSASSGRTSGSRALPRAERSRSYGVLPLSFRPHRASRRPADATQAAAAADQAERSLRREVFQTPGPLALELRMPTGYIQVQAGERSETIVELESSSGRDEVRQALEDARIEMRPRGDGHAVIVDVRLRRRWGLGFDRGDISMRVSCPIGADVEASTASGDMDLRGRLGAFSAEVASGDVRGE